MTEAGRMAESTGMILNQGKYFCVMVVRVFAPVKVFVKKQCLTVRVKIWVRVVLLRHSDYHEFTSPTEDQFFSTSA